MRLSMFLTVTHVSLTCGFFVLKHHLNFQLKSHNIMTLFSEMNGFFFSKPNDFFPINYVFIVAF